MHHTWQPLTIPMLKVRKTWNDPILVSLTTVGSCVEPFVSIVQRSCNYNAWRIFDGNELHIRATNDIVAGSEIILPYPETYDYEHRTALLKGTWNVSCECKFCVKGPIGPTDVFRERILELVDLDGEKAASRFQDIQRAIQDMQAAGFALGADLSYYLYRAVCSTLISVHESDLLRSQDVPNNALPDPTQHDAANVDSSPPWYPIPSHSPCSAFKVQYNHSTYSSTSPRAVACLAYALDADADTHLEKVLRQRAPRCSSSENYV
jgi:hypothetical protein